MPLPRLHARPRARLRRPSRRRVGSLPPERLASYHKLLAEAQAVAAKTDARLRAQRERKSKTISKAAKEYFKLTGGG